jgi:hypothetical protein
MFILFCPVLNYAVTVRGNKYALLIFHLEENNNAAVEIMLNTGIA